MIDTENMKQTRVKKDTGIFIGKGNKKNNYEFYEQKLRTFS